MRIYADEEKKELITVICNMCSKELKVDHHIIKEGCFCGEQRFGYFSDRDGQKESFDLCESCYAKMTGAFKIPVDKEEITELL